MGKQVRVWVDLVMLYHHTLCSVFKPVLWLTLFLAYNAADKLDKGPWSAVTAIQLCIFQYGRCLNMVGIVIYGW